MNNIDLYNSFHFSLIQLKNYHSSDYTKGNGIPSNFVAKMIHGTAEIKTKHKTLSISEGDIFFIPQGLKYQSFWYADDVNRIEWFSIGFDAYPTKNDCRFLLQKIKCNTKALELFDLLCEDITVNCSSVGILYQFISEISKTMEKEYHPYNLITEKALEFMQNTPEFTMKDVAEYCEISESGLYLKSFSVRLEPSSLSSQLSGYMSSAPIEIESFRSSSAIPKDT